MNLVFLQQGDLLSSLFSQHQFTTVALAAILIYAGYVTFKQWGWI